MRVRTPEEVLDAMPDPDEEPSIRDLVKTPTPARYRKIKAKSPEERLRTAFALTAWARRFKRDGDDGPKGRA